MPAGPDRTVESVEFFRRRRKTDRLADHLANRQRGRHERRHRASSENSPIKSQLGVKSHRLIDGVLAGHRVRDKKDVMRPERIFDRVANSAVSLFVDEQAARGVDQQNIANIFLTASTACRKSPPAKSPDWNRNRQLPLPCQGSSIARSPLDDRYPPKRDHGRALFVFL